MKIFLLGFMGVGKTTIGKKLAAALQYPFVDLDARVAEKHNMSVPDIFRYFGEAYFRKCEVDTLQELIHSYDSFVLACGGGTPIYHNNMEIMNAAGTTIYMRAGIDFLISRIKQSPVVRPMVKKLSENGSENGLSTLFEQRKPLYEQALRIVDVEKLPSNEVVERIMEIL